jgi:hypothetical protein
VNAGLAGLRREIEALPFDRLVEQFVLLAGCYQDLGDLAEWRWKFVVEELARRLDSLGPREAA